MPASPPSVPGRYRFHDPRIASIAAVAAPVEAVMRRDDDRDWSSLSPGAKRRWIADKGGSRSDTPQVRARRAQRAYERGEPLSPEHTGHGGLYNASFSGVPTAAGVVQVSTTDRVESRRLGEFNRDLLALGAGDLDPTAFNARWQRRARTVGGYELVADADTALAMLAESGPPSEPFYKKRRVRRGRAS